MELPDNIKNMDYNIYHPRPGHEARFEKKLLKAFPEQRKKKQNRKIWWIAASIVIFLGAGMLSLWVNKPVSQTDRLLQKNTAYFSSVIEKEVKSLPKTKSPEAKQLIQETMKQLDQLEKEYQKITRDYKQNSENKNLLNALIENFKKRIELLEFTKFQLKELEKLKTENHVQNKA